MSNVYDLVTYRINLREGWADPMRFVRITQQLVDSMIAHRSGYPRAPAQKRRNRSKGAHHGQR